MLSYTEENYLKALLKISFDSGHDGVGTNELAAALEVRPASANDMLKKLKEKALVDYEKYGKITLTPEGRTRATDIIRKHRLWETFLFEKLEFTWDEVHEVAEQLEHIRSDKLTDRLDKYLNYPAFDPHGDPIPGPGGELKLPQRRTLAEVPVGEGSTMVAVRDNSSDFLQYVAQVGLHLSARLVVLSRQDYDAIMVIEVNGVRSTVSQKFAENIYVE